MRKTHIIGLLMAVLLVTTVGSIPALAQEEEPPAVEPERLTMFTPYPVQEVEVGENVSLDLTLRTSSPQRVDLDTEGLPDDWTATYRGGGDVIQAVYVEAEGEASIDLRIDLPRDVEPGSYRFSAIGRGEETEVEVPIELVVAERVPASLELEVELPILRGTPDTTFRYSGTLRNDGDEDLVVNLQANAPPGFQVIFKLSGQEVTSAPLAANESKRLSVEVEPFTDVPADTYTVDVIAQGGGARATTSLTAEVIGQSELSLSGVDGRLSGEVRTGEETPLQLVVVNRGSAPARNVTLSTSPPNGWSVDFEPEEIPEVPAGQQVEVTARVTPPEQAVAGDYMITFRARPEDGSTESVEYRVTVRTSTIWGVVGVGLIAVAVAVVALAVMRFGRR